MRAKYVVLCLAFTLLSMANNLTFAQQGGNRLTCATVPGFKSETEIKIPPKQRIYTLDVTFIGKRPTNKEIDRVLRDCLAVAVKRDATKDILASAWLRKRSGGNPYDDDLLHPWGGLKYLSYTAASKSIGVHDLELKLKRQSK